MANQGNPVSSRSSIAHRFNLVLVVLYLVSIAVSAPTIYIYSKQ